MVRVARGVKRIGITMGDPAGIGPEIIAGALANIARPIASRFEFVVVGNARLFSRFAKPAGVDPVFIDITQKGAQHKPGRPTDASGYDSLRYLQYAVDMIRNGQLSALVTGPVCKESLGKFIPGFKGHTTFLAESFACKNVEMLFSAPDMKMVLVTRHIPLKSVVSHISRRKVEAVITAAANYLKHKFRIVSPRIAVCGLNPHAGEGGQIGTEEIAEIIPAVRALVRRGWDIHGPYPADTIFEPRNCRNYDLVVTMYHDQGLPVLKALHFDDLVNITVGLPFVRTSPAHGTAFGIAGRGVASYGSMRAAIQLAARLMT